MNILSQRDLKDIAKAKEIVHREIKKAAEKAEKVGVKNVVQFNGKNRRDSL